MNRIQTSNVSISYGNIKCPIGKPSITVNFPLKHYRATVANTDTGRLQPLPRTLFDTYLEYRMLAKFEPNRMVRNVYFILFFFLIFFFDKKPSLKKKTNIFDKALTPFCKTFLLLKLLFNGELSVFKLLSFSVPKIMVVRHV